MKACIISNGAIEDYNFYIPIIKNYDLIICADGGFEHAKKMKILPSVVVGDFDSITSEAYDELAKSNIKIKTYPVEKDETDTEIAVKYAVEKKCREILLIAALGSRFDHSYANISLLKYIMDSGSKGIILNKHNEIHLINNELELRGKPGDKLSLLPITQKVCGVTTIGLYYELEDAELIYGNSFGVSNEFVDDTAIITIGKGLILVIKAND